MREYVKEAIRYKQDLHCFYLQMLVRKYRYTIRRKWSIVQLKLNEKNDDNKEIKSVEHFSSLFYVENNKPALATFTVKVTNNAGRKIYTIELMELKKVEGKVQGKVQKLHQATSTFDTLNISQIADKINRASKVVGYTIRRKWSIVQQKKYLELVVK